MRLPSLLLCSFILLGCGDDGGSSGGVDAATQTDGNMPVPDSNIDAPPAPAMITISGTANSRSIGGSQPVSMAMIGAYRSSDEMTPVATTMTDAQGNFTLTITTGGVSLDGYLKATKQGMADTYLYPPEPIAMDTTMVPINMVTTGNYGTIYTLTQTQEQANTGIIAMIVQDAAKMPVMGATMTSTPSGTYKYNGTNGLPSSSAMSTAADGTAYFMNAPVGPVTVGASKAGGTWKSHGVKVFASSLTTTLVVPQ